MKNINKEKECNCCHLIKNIDDFYHSKSKENSATFCKICYNDIGKLDRITLFKSPTRECISCKEQKPKNQFKQYNKTCRDCVIKKDREREFCKENNVKKCNFCNEFKTFNYFFKNRDGYSHDCRACRHERFPYKLKPRTSEETTKGREHKKKYREENPKKVLFMSAKSRAKRNNTNFTIKREDIEDIPEKCPVLGIKLERQKNKLASCSPTLDKVNNESGYVQNNIKVISYKANRIKSNGTADEHELIAIYMRENWPDQIEYEI